MRVSVRKGYRIQITAKKPEEKAILTRFENRGIHILAVSFKNDEHSIIIEPLLLKGGI